MAETICASIMQRTGLSLMPFGAGFFDFLPTQRGIFIAID